MRHKFLTGGLKPTKVFYYCLPLLFSSLFLSTGCSHLSWPLLRNDNDEFVAKNHDLFPGYVDQFFPGAQVYEKLVPTVDQARKQIVVVEVKRLTNSEENYNEANLTWSGSGALLGYEIITDKHRKIMLKDMVGNFSKELLVLPNKNNQFLDGILKKNIHSYNASLRWAKDNRKYAFMSNGGMGNYSIYIGEIDSGSSPIADSPLKEGYPIWNPAGDELIFVSARSGNGDIYYISLADRQAIQLSNSAATDIFPEWFADGSKVIYSSGESRQHNLHYLEKNKDGKWQSPAVFLESDYDCLRPTVSPNGKYVAFYSNYGDSEDLDGNWNIHVLPFRAGYKYSAKELRSSIIATNVVVDINTGPAWTPDGKKVLYVNSDSTKYNPIYGYDLASGNRFMLQTNTKMNRDLQISKTGVLSFRAQVGSWERVFVALTNQGAQIQRPQDESYQVVYPQLLQGKKGSLL